jgi:hypothetical protein
VPAVGVDLPAGRGVREELVLSNKKGVRLSLVNPLFYTKLYLY